MPYQHKTNTGSLFKNDDRTQETHPTHKGSTDIEGVEYWINGWSNKTADGRGYLKLSFKAKEARQAQPAPAAPVQESFDDDIPF